MPISRATPSTYLALIDGIVMGGGRGRFLHGSHRIVTENASFAMPEVGIGFFPMSAGSHLLPQTPGDFGLYLGLTGTGSNGAISSGRGSRRCDRGEGSGGAGRSSCEQDARCRAEAFQKQPARETDDARLHQIAQLFRAEEFDDLMVGLAHAADGGNEMAAGLRDTIAARSPTSVKVAFAQIRGRRHARHGRLHADEYAS